MNKLILIFILASSSLFCQEEDAKIFWLNQKAQEYNELNNDSAFYFAEKAFKLSSDKGKIDQAVISQINIGEYYLNKQNYSNSISAYQKGNQLVKKIKSKELEKKIFFGLGVVYYYKAQFDSSVYYLTNALKLKNSASLSEIDGRIESALGLNYTNLKEFDQAKNHFLKSKRIFSSINYTIGIGQALNNLGRLYQIQEMPAKALQYFQQNIKYIPKGDDYEFGVTYSNIGAAYGKLKMLDSANYYNNKALVLSKKANDYEGELICYNNLASNYRDQNKLKLSLNFFFKALSMVDSLGSKDNKKEILLNISQVYKKMGAYEKSLDYFQRYTELKNQLFNETKHKSVLEIEAKYKASLQDKQIAELKVKRQQSETDKLSFKYNIFIGGTIVFIILIAIFWYIRANMVRLKNEQQIAITTAALDSEEKERLRISQEIHDDLGGVLGMSRMLFSRAKKYLFEENPELYQRIDHLLVEANTRSRAISHDLFSPTLQQFGLSKALEELMNNVRQAKPECRILFEASGEDSQLNEQIALNVYRISQELINNTFKYAEASEINMKVQIASQHVQYSYSDNGLGVDLEKAKKGVGLKSIQSRINRFKGDVKFQSEPGKGFHVNIQLN